MHLEVVPEGNCKICCVARESVRDDGHAMGVQSHSLEEIRASRYMRSVRSALSDGRKIPVCGYCWEQEQRGEQSQREYWNGRFRESLSTLREQLQQGGSAAEPLPIEYLQISVGNKCNLACRMCNGSYSSRIEEDPVHSKWSGSKWSGKMSRDDIAWPEAGGVRGLRGLFGRHPKARASWVPGTSWFEQPEFVEKDMMAAGSTLKLLYVTGGEPLFVPAFDRMLDDYVARGLAQNMVISLNTNLFHNERRLARAMDSLLRFKGCQLAPSIDGYGDVYEYVRYPARWDIVERNIRFVTRLSEERGNLEFMLTTVAQAYNCLSLVELLSFADELWVECKPHMLEGPRQLRPEVLPPDLRLRAAERLRAYAATPADPGTRSFNRAHATRVANYLDAIQETPEIDDVRRLFVKFTRELDESRGQSLERTVPELEPLMARFA
jgi:pyruvate-formate lyase-activating enzyme